jgi:hypothetical protein
VLNGVGFGSRMDYHAREAAGPRNGPVTLEWVRSEATSRCGAKWAAPRRTCRAIRGSTSG